ncbi:hypothetical protein NKJ46_18495 [Mesorhizobium sp. M0166]|uniref:hypothetical protein n=1 Tax=Mesorhizobium sp. M0166 TaxID=2956902 RepID=UPI00333B3F48
MANYKTRLSVFSSSGPPPAFELGNDEFARLERIYGVTINEGARERLQFLSLSFLRWRKAELNSENYAEVRRQFNVVREAVQAFQSFAYGTMIPRTDSGGVLSGKINSNLEDFPVSVRGRQILVAADTNSSAWNWVEDSRSLAIKIDAQFLMNFGISMGCVMAAVDKEISDEEAEQHSGFTPGNAFKDFLQQMRRWAKDNGFIYGPLDHVAEPSSFSRFLFELNRLFPAEFREPVTSAGGVAERLRTLMKKGKKSDGGK